MKLLVVFTTRFATELVDLILKADTFRETYCSYSVLGYIKITSSHSRNAPMASAPSFFTAHDITHYITASSIRNLSLYIMLSNAKYRLCTQLKVKRLIVALTFLLCRPLKEIARYAAQRAKKSSVLRQAKQILK